jgi:NADPH-dependent 2,4-dienoyl-CoA reductase/sulfur reductase-like enzyme
VGSSLPGKNEPVAHLVVVGGSDAGISAALRARELDPRSEVTVFVADRYPNFSICGIPYHVSGEVPDWRSLAHRTVGELEAAGLRLRLETVARRIEVDDHRLVVTGPGGTEEVVAYDALVIGTGAVPVVPPIEGLTGSTPLGGRDAVHLLHTMGDTFDLLRTVEERAPERAVIVGAGYIGIEMAEALTARGLAVTQLEQLPEVLPTLDPSLGALVREELAAHGVEVRTSTAVEGITRSRGALEVATRAASGQRGRCRADVVLVVAGVRPETALAARAGARLGYRGAIAVDPEMRTGLPGVFAAGDCVVTHHRLLGETYVPLGTTAHKQGRVAGENALGGARRFAGSLGTQVVKVFEMAAARTGLRDVEARSAGLHSRTVAFEGDDHKAYYPGSHRIRMRTTGDTTSGRLLGVQLFGHRHAEVAKRIDVAAAAIFAGIGVEELSDLDLSYTPPLGSPWDLVQAGAQAWVREAPSSPVGAG